MKKLGESTFAEVFHGNHRAKNVAIKIIPYGGALLVNGLPQTHPDDGRELPPFSLFFFPLLLFSFPSRLFVLFLFLFGSLAVYQEIKITKLLGNIEKHMGSQFEPHANFVKPHSYVSFLFLFFFFFLFFFLFCLTELIDAIFLGLPFVKVYTLKR